MKMGSVLNNPRQESPLFAGGKSLGVKHWIAFDREQNEWIVLDRLKGNRVLRSQTMIRRQRYEKGFFENDLCRQVSTVDRVAHEADVYYARTQRVELLTYVHLEELDFDLGIKLTKSLGENGHDAEGRRMDKADHEPTIISVSCSTRFDRRIL